MQPANVYLFIKKALPLFNTLEESAVRISIFWL